ncbi:ABC transporter ATP-binding protein [Aliiruegeria lutimaris]|uniref:Putative ABC transport system ATP-binding protein n=1 Tax=Aliiruegeria lutimaris TaxID=571298 RepID=A0A1G8J0W3_9RHOB|nr:ABC transporter ATP-binding protein [Aliiruegeria lutimaris]SDI24360.1 putative ABC transport system ATP-binding protein [Aliiruegeria lutimaris]
MLIDARDLTKTFTTADGKLPVLNGISLQLQPGETLALTGESGSGKSTLLHLLAALDTPDSGTIRHQDDDITSGNDTSRAAVRRNRIGLVFQQFNLIPSLDIAANLAFQARLAGRYDADWCAVLSQRLGLSELLSRYPEQLSGGQQQRVAIGRALAPRPPVLLADEPTGNLDEATADSVLEMMLELVDETGAGLLMVTHSTRLAGRLSRRLHLSQGRVA